MFPVGVGVCGRVIRHIAGGGHVADLPIAELPVEVQAPTLLIAVGQDGAGMVSARGEGRDVGQPAHRTWGVPAHIRGDKAVGGGGAVAWLPVGVVSPAFHGSAAPCHRLD